MAVAIRGSGENGSTGTGNLVVTTDVGATDGDTILIFVNVNNASSGVHPTPACTGFSSLGTSTASVWSRTTCLGKIASGNGTSYTITGFTGADAKYAAVVILSGADSSLPTNIVTTPDASSNTTFSIPAITNADTNSMDVVCVGYGGNNSQGTPDNLSSWGSSLTPLIDGAVDSGGSNYYAGLGVATALRASSGAQAATSVTAAVADVSAAIRIEVLEAAAGGTTYNQSASGTVTTAGAALKQTGKLSAGTLTTAAALAKQTSTARVGTLTTAGAAAKQTQRTHVGTLTSAGSLSRQAGKLSAGTLSTAGALSRSTAHALAGTLTTAGALSAVKTALLSLVGALSPAGALSRQGQKATDGALSGAGALNRAVSRALSGTLSSAATLAAVKTALVSLTGTLGTAGALNRQTNKALSATLAGAGAVGRAISHVLSGILSAVGALTSSGGTLTTTTTVILPDAYLYDSAGATGSIAGATIIAGPNQSSPTGAVSGATLPGGPTQGSPTGPVSGATVQPSETTYD